MPPFFEIYQSRISLTAITSIFDDFLANFIKELRSKVHLPFLDDWKKDQDPKYKHLLEWAFSESQKCNIGDEKAITRLSKTFGIIDEARRLRNIILHNHGLFDEIYGRDSIKIKEVEKVRHPDYEKFEVNGEPIALIINSSDINNFSGAHIEILHILHNQIQKEYFGHPEPYEYGKEGKDIGWHYALWGKSKISEIKAINMRESYLKI